MGETRVVEAAAEAWQEAQTAGISSIPATQNATAASNDASKPAAASRDASELTEGAEKAAKDLANLLEDQPKRPVRRKARNGYLYTKDEFLDFYDDEGEDRWEVADQTEEYGWGATDVDSILGRAL